jgi:hypothetical protein
VIHAIAKQVRLDAEFVLSAPEVLAGVLCEVTESSSYLLAIARIAIDILLQIISKNSISSCT